MAYEFDSFYGGIDFTWIKQAADHSSSAEGKTVRRAAEGEDLELLELLPPHRPMWVRRGPKEYTEVLWIARIALWTYRWSHSGEGTIKREQLVLVAGEFCDEEFRLEAYSMQQLALAVPDGATIEAFDASNWDAGMLYREISIHGRGFCGPDEDA